MTDVADTTLDPSVSAADSYRPPANWTSRLKLDKYSALYLWAAFIIGFGLTTGSYLTRTSISLTFSEKTIVCVLALAFLIPLVTDTFDLCIGNNLGLSLVILFKLNEEGWPMWLTAIIAITATGFVGFVNGFFVVKLRVNSFIATLGMSQVVRAAVFYISGNRQIVTPLPTSFTDIGTKRWLFNLPNYFFMMLLIAVALWFVLEHTALGRYMFATGGGREAARLSGVNTDRLTWGSLVVSGVVAGFAGFVFAYKNSIFQNSAGDGLLFPAIAAVFFGASQLKGRANVWGTMIAVFALAFGIKGIQLAFNAGAWLDPLFNGVSLLAAVSLASRQAVIKVRKRKAAQVAPAAPA
jgi:ribose transport system permease protein